MEEMEDMEEKAKIYKKKNIYIYIYACIYTCRNNDVNKEN